MKKLLTNSKKNVVRNLVYALLFISPIVVASSCKDKVTCDYESNEYKTAKVTAATDSTNFVNHKETASQQFLGRVLYFVNQGQTEEQAWTSAINDALTNPNAPADIKAWAEQYNVCLNAFNTSVENRQGSYKSWQECEEQK